MKQSFTFDYKNSILKIVQTQAVSQLTKLIQNVPEYI